VAERDSVTRRFPDGNLGRPRLAALALSCWTNSRIAAAFSSLRDTHWCVALFLIHLCSFGERGIPRTILTSFRFTGQANSLSLSRTEAWQDTRVRYPSYIGIIRVFWHFEKSAIFPPLAGPRMAVGGMWVGGLIVPCF